MTLPSGTALMELSETDFAVADPAADVRGRSVVDSSGEEMGKVDELLIDDTEARVRMLRIEHGGVLGIGAEHYLIPVDAVTGVTADEVSIDRGRSKLTDVPGYDPDVSYEPAYYRNVYAWWNYSPYWTPDYSLPPFPHYPAA
ncbi:MAG: PRC-barrel domain-containing protein [Halobacteriales archaeon]|nr:PRC-barrel domain-containing protein [Halobacteriales archaeon]